MKLSTVLFFSIMFLFSCKSDPDKLQIGQKTTIKVQSPDETGEETLHNFEGTVDISTLFKTVPLRRFCLEL